VIEGVSRVIVEVEDRDRALKFRPESMDTGAETIDVTEVWQSDQNQAASLELVEVKEQSPRQTLRDDCVREELVVVGRRIDKEDSDAARPTGTASSSGQAAPEGGGERTTPTWSQRARVASTSQRASASPAMRSHRWSMTLAGECGTQ
jgi:hypothetical protein